MSESTDRITEPGNSPTDTAVAEWIGEKAYQYWIQITHRIFMRTLLTILLVLGLSGCGDVYRYLKSGDVGWALKKELRDKKSTRVEIAKLTDFQWDELFLFGPYQPTDEVCKRLELSPVDCESVITAESTDDGEMLMVFRHKGKVVHTELHIRWHGDFTPVPDEPFTPRTAIFAVSIEGKGALGEDWLKLSPIAESALSRHSSGPSKTALLPSSEPARWAS